MFALRPDQHDVRLSWQTTMGIILRRAVLTEETIHLVKGTRSRVRITSKERAQIHRVILGILPCSRITKQRKAAGSPNGVLSTQRSRSPAEQKKRRGLEEDVSVVAFFDKERHKVRVVYLRTSCRRRLNRYCGWPKILEIEPASSVNSTLGTLNEILGKKRTILKDDLTLVSS